MTKLCGCFRPAGDESTVMRHLQAMLRVMKHDVSLHEDYALFPGGGLAALTHAKDAKNGFLWDEQRTVCLGLCGHIVNLDSERLASYHNGNAPSTGHAGSFLIHAFKDHGEAILDKLNGTFAFALYDLTTAMLTVANDRYGFMPLYYYYDGDQLVFASEVKALLQVVGPQEFDWESFADFFYIGHMMGQKTLFKHIQALDSAQILTYSNGNLHKSKYYDFTRTPVIDREEVSTQKLVALFTEAVRRRVTNTGPNALLLSGGFDSRFILGVLHNLAADLRIISLEHATERQGADGKLALLLANCLRLNCDYRRTRKHFKTSTDCLKVFYILDGMVPTWELFIGEIYPELENGLGTIWDGLALDVALGGSHQIPGGTQKNVPHFIAKRLTNRLILRLILTPQYFYALDARFMPNLQHAIAAIPDSENQFLYFLLKNRTRRRISINAYQLFASKAEPMTPATDMDFMDYVLSISSDLKLNHKTYIGMLRKTFPLLTTIPVISDGAIFQFDRDELRKK